MAGDKVNPSNVWGPNQYAAPAPHRPDASTVGPGGNIVDRARIPANSETLSKNQTPANPLGTPDNYGSRG